MLVENAGEQRKTQASIQHFNNQLHVTFSTLANRPLPTLSGNPESVPAPTILGGVGMAAVGSFPVGGR